MSITFIEKEGAIRLKPYIGFTYGGIDMTEMGIYRVTSGEGYPVNVTPNQEITTNENNGIGTQVTRIDNLGDELSIPIAFNSLTEGNLRKLQRLLASDDMVTLYFHEAPTYPYKVMPAGAPQLTWLCFFEGGKRVYKGEGTLVFKTFGLDMKSDSFFIDTFLTFKDGVHPKLSYEISSDEDYIIHEVTGKKLSDCLEYRGMFNTKYEIPGTPMKIVPFSTSSFSVSGSSTGYHPFVVTPHSFIKRIVLDAKDITGATKINISNCTSNVYNSATNTVFSIDLNTDKDQTITINFDYCQRLEKFDKRKKYAIVESIETTNDDVTPVFLTNRVSQSSSNVSCALNVNNALAATKRIYFSGEVQKNERELENKALNKLSCLQLVTDNNKAVTVKEIVFR